MSNEFGENGRGSNSRIESSVSRVAANADIVALALERPNSSTLNGVYQLGAELQSRLYTNDDPKWPEGFRQGLRGAGTEFGARVGITMIDRDRVDLGYEAGNLNAWLGGKGLEVLVGAESSLNPMWSGVVDVGDRESGYYFDGKSFDPAAYGALAENVAGRFVYMAKQVEAKSPGSVESRILNMAASVQTAVATEIVSVANGGKGLSGEQVMEIMKPALAGVGVTISEKK